MKGVCTKRNASRSTSRKGPDMIMVYFNYVGQFWTRLYKPDLFWIIHTCESGLRVVWLRNLDSVQSVSSAEEGRVSRLIWSISIFIGTDLVH